MLIGLVRQDYVPCALLVRAVQKLGARLVRQVTSYNYLSFIETAK